MLFRSLVTDPAKVEAVRAAAEGSSVVDSIDPSETGSAGVRFNVTLDVEGPGVLYFVRTNHWHGSPWHYEIDGVDHLVEDRVELLLRRVPRLEQVVVDVDEVDRRDRGIGVGVGRQRKRFQRALFGRQQRDLDLGLQPAGPPRDILTGFLAPDERESYGRPVGVAIGLLGVAMVVGGLFARAEVRVMAQAICGSCASDPIVGMPTRPTS